MASPDRAWMSDDQAIRNREDSAAPAKRGIRWGAISGVTSDAASQALKVWKNPLVSSASMN